jgi:hypothetical protein
MSRPVIVLALALAFTASGAASAQTRDPMPARVWPAYLAATITSCGLRPAEWGDKLLSGMVSEMMTSPELWGIGIESVLGVRYPESSGVGRSLAGLRVTQRIGALLHRRMPQQVCQEASRQAPGRDRVAEAARSGNEAEVLPEEYLVIAEGMFVVTLANDVCRIKSKQWGDDAAVAVLTPLTVLHDNAPAGSARVRRRYTATLDALQPAAEYAARRAREIYGPAVCTSLRTWPELRTADAAAEASRRQRTAPGGQLRGVGSAVPPP